MAYPFTITCLECRQLSPLLSIDPVEGAGEAWIRLRMGCGHAPSVPARHQLAIERVAIGSSGAFALYDPDGRPTYLVHGERV